MSTLPERVGGSVSLRLAAVGGLVALAAGSAIALAPKPLLIIVMAAALVGLAGALVAGPRRLPRVSDALGTRFYVYLPAALLFTSLVQLIDREATSSSIGPAAIYEFALQGAACGIILLGMQAGRIKARLNLPAILWALFGALGMASALWAPSATLALLKGGQLLVVALAGIILSANFPSREAIGRFLGRYAALLFAVIMLIQAATQGSGSLYQAYEVGNPMYVDGRVRLSLLAIYPLTLGLVASALILLLLVSRPKLVDWLAIAFLGVIDYLTFSRGPLAILAMLVVTYLLLRLLESSAGSSLWTSLAVLLGAGLLIGSALVAVNSTGLISDLVKSYLPADTASLNGRLPLWRDTIQQVLDAAYTPSGLLFGHGFASFRFYGLTIFSYAGETHNAPLQVLYELGLLGICLWTSAIAACFVQVWNRRDRIGRNLIRLLPLLFLIAIELLDSSLADSRSFVLVILLLYSFRPSSPQEATEPAGTERPRGGITGAIPALPERP